MSGERGQEKDHEGLVHQINSVHIYPAGRREPATTSKQERDSFVLTIRRSLGERSLRAQRSRRKGSSAGLRVGALGLLSRVIRAAHPMLTAVWCAR